MHEAYRDDYASLMDRNGNSLIPGSVRRAVSALVFIGLIAGMGVWAWRLGTRDAREVPIIRAMEGPARITPEDQGGFVAPNTDLEINSVLEGNPVPAPREATTPLAQPEVLTEEDGPQGTLEITATAPEPVEDPDAEITLGGEPVEMLPEDSISGVTPTVRPGELSALVESLQTSDSDESEETASIPTGPRPLSRPRHLRAAPAAVATSSATPAAATPVVPKEVGSVATGSRLIQLGAFDSEEITRSAWASLVAKHADLLGSKSLYVQRTTNNSRVFYRLRVAGFSDTTQTRDMCEALRARGVDCIPVTVQQMAPRAVIFGCTGTELTPEELRFFASSDPWGFILFARNVESPGQVRGLTDALRQAVGRDAPILIDQEGGRVARMRGPHWREWEPALDECQHFSDVETCAQAMRLRYRLMAGELRDVGIDINCAPVLDLVQDYSHPVLKNRCYGPDAHGVATTGRAVAEGLLQGGVLPVVKHMPGQGRADLDSHRDLPVVSTPHTELTNTDFAAFKRLADLPMAMSAHVVYSDIDPTAPATLSPRMNTIMRQEIGFDGLLMTDDLSMQALTGPFGKRAETALAAGCDIVLHCNGKPEEMEPVADAVLRLEGRSLERADAALSLRQEPQPADFATLEAEYAALRERTVHA